MTDKDKKPDDRANRLKNNLRSNLQKRKSQIRARKTEAETTIKEETDKPK